MTKPTIDLAEPLDISEERGGWVAQGEAPRMRKWMRDALPWLESYLIHGYVDEDELRALIAQVKRGEP